MTDQTPGPREVASPSKRGGGDLMKVSDLRAMVATLRRFDERGVRRLALVGAAAFLAGTSEAAVLALISSVAVSTTGEDVAESALGPISLAPGPALGLAAGLLVATLVFGFVLARVSSAIAADAGLAARSALLSGFHGSSFSEKSAHRTAALQERLTTYVDRFLFGFNSVAQLTSAALSLTSFAIMALIIDPVAVVALGAVGLLVVAVQRPMTVRMKRSSRRLAQQRASYAEGATESVLLAREMAVFGVGSVAGERLLELDRSVAVDFRRTRFYTALTPRLFQVLAFALIVGALAVIRALGAVDLAGIAAVALILLRSLTYGQTLLGQLQSLSEYRPYTDELTAQIDAYAASREVGGSIDVGPVAHIDLSDVTFSYGEGPALSGLDLTISAGETLGVVGPSGSGKTTLVNLLLRLYPPTLGRISINGTALAEVADDEWHRMTAIVPQEPRLLHGTIADNIRFFRPLDAADVEKAAAEAHIADFIASLHLGIDSPVGELGQGLSGGQRQRICIARALAGRPELLVLDEPTSALDGESEAAIQATLSELKGSVTMVLVAHRLSTLSICDRILVIDKGRVAALGTPEDLRRSSPYFREAMAHAGL